MAGNPTPSIADLDRMFMEKLRQLRTRSWSERTNSLLEKMNKCSRDVGVLRNTVNGELSFIPMGCDKKLCPYCVRVWSDNLQIRIKRAINTVSPKHLRHLVLTIPNAIRGDLQDACDDLFKTFREWRNRGRRAGWWNSIDGYSYKLEVDHNKRREAPWHPHLHILILTKSGFDFTRESPARKAWIQCTKLVDRIANPGAQYITSCSSRNIAKEVGKYTMKPLQLYNLDDIGIIESIGMADKRRFTAFQGGLKGAEEEKESCCVWEGNLSEFVDSMATSKTSERIVREFLEQHGDDERLGGRIKWLKGIQDGHAEE